MKKLKSKKGFSLIELLVVIAIIGVLSAVGITAYTGYTATAKEQASRSQFAQVVSLLNAESAKCGLGSGTYAWGDACTVATVTASSVVDHLHDDLGMKNPYNNTQAKGEFMAITGLPDADGEMSIVVSGTSITVTAQVNNTPTQLAMTVSQAN